MPSIAGVFGSEPTYEGLKHLRSKRLRYPAGRSEPTYEGLKPPFLRALVPGL